MFADFKTELIVNPEIALNRWNSLILKIKPYVTIRQAFECGELGKSKHCDVLQFILKKGKDILLMAQAQEYMLPVLNKKFL